MNFKKTMLSIVMIIAFCAYTGYENAHGDSGNLIALVQGDLQRSQPSAVSATNTSFNGNSQPLQTSADLASAQKSSNPVAVSPQAPSKTPVDTPAPAPAPTPQKPQGQYRDGTYTGPSVYVYYGYIQVKATIQNGALADVAFLQYPNDRSTSRYINGQAMPMLKQEAITAQNANVDGVSGASDTSQGFVESLGAALSQARA